MSQPNPTIIAYPRVVMICNDDGPCGPFAPFLLPFSRALQAALQRLNTQFPYNNQTKPSVTEPLVYVVTPAAQQSWTGKQLSRWGSVAVTANWQFDGDSSNLAATATEAASIVRQQTPSDEVALWATVDASPASTANIGLTLLKPTPPSIPVDLVISGPNLGRNTGRSFMLSSGTIGAAIEASIHGVKSVALSFGYDRSACDYSEASIRAACDIAVSTILQLYQLWPLQPHRVGIDIFNINVPLKMNVADVAYPRIMMTHAVNDQVGSLYRIKKPKPPSEAGSAAPSASPQPSSVTSNNARGETSAPSAECLTHTNILSLSHKSAAEFYVDFGSHKLNQSKPANWIGSDLWALSEGYVSITPLSSSLMECIHTHPELATIANMFPPQEGTICAATKNQALQMSLLPSGSNSSSVVSSSNAPSLPTRSMDSYLHEAIVLLLNHLYPPPSLESNDAAPFFLTGNTVRLLSEITRKAFFALTDARQQIDGASTTSTRTREIIQKIQKNVKDVLPETDSVFTALRLAASAGGSNRASVDDVIPIRALLVRFFRSLSDVAKSAGHVLLFTMDTAIVVARHAELKQLTEELFTVSNNPDDASTSVNQSVSFGEWCLRDLQLGIERSSESQAAKLFVTQLAAEGRTAQLASAGVSDTSSIHFIGSRMFSIQSPTSLDPNQLKETVLVKALHAALLQSRSSSSSASSSTLAESSEYVATFERVLAESIVTPAVLSQKAYFSDFDGMEFIGPVHYALFDFDYSNSTRLRADISYFPSHPHLFEGLLYDRRTGLPYCSAQILPEEEEEYGQLIQHMTSYISRFQAKSTTQASVASPALSSADEKLAIANVRRSVQILATATDAKEQSIAISSPANETYSQDDA